MKKLLILALIAFSSCTDNTRVKVYGGTQSINIPKNHVFVNASWKGESLWILTKDTTTKAFHYHEKSSFGLAEGEIVFK